MKTLELRLQQLQLLMMTTMSVPTQLLNQIISTGDTDMHAITRRNFLPFYSLTKRNNAENIYYRETPRFYYVYPYTSAFMTPCLLPNSQTCFLILDQFSKMLHFPSAVILNLTNELKYNKQHQTSSPGITPHISKLLRLS